MACDDMDGRRRGKREEGEKPRVSTRFSLGMDKERPDWRQRTVEPVSRDQILRRKRRQKKTFSLFSFYQEQDWQQRCLCYLLNSKMRRSWLRYIFATPQGTGLILPCLALITTRAFSWYKSIAYKSIKLGSNVVMGISDSMSVCVCMYRYVCMYGHHI